MIVIISCHRNRRWRMVCSISWRCIHTTTRQPSNAMIAMKKSIFTPSAVRCAYSAPSITIPPIAQPIRDFFPPKSSSNAAISSMTPIPILPRGSRPSEEKIIIDSGCAVNLKNKLCKKIAAEASLAIRKRTDMKQRQNKI